MPTSQRSCCYPYLCWIQFRANQRSYLGRHFTVPGARDSIDIVSTSQIPRLLFETFSKGDLLTSIRKRITERKVYHCQLLITHHLSLFSRAATFQFFDRVCTTSVLPPSCFGLRLCRLQITASATRRNITQGPMKLFTLSFTNISIASSQPRTIDSVTARISRKVLLH